MNSILQAKPIVVIFTNLKEECPGAKGQFARGAYPVVTTRSHEFLKALDEYQDTVGAALMVTRNYRNREALHHAAKQLYGKVVDLQLTPDGLEQMSGIFNRETHCPARADEYFYRDIDPRTNFFEGFYPGLNWTLIMRRIRIEARIMSCPGD